MSQQRFLIIISILFISSAAYSLELINMGTLPYSPKVKQEILDGNIFAISEVDSYKEKKIPKQSLDFSIAGLHPKNCQIALKTLSRFENYHSYIGVIDKSTYDDKTRHLYLHIAAVVPPVKMTLNVDIDRPTVPGVYPFTFTTGFLKGLQAAIHISEYNEKCLFFADAKWRGPDTGYADFFLSFFTRALSEVSMKKLFKISQE